MTGRDPQRGFALLIVLWTLALLALLGTQIVAAGRGDTQLARNLLDAAELKAATDGAIQQAVFGLLLPPAQRWSADGTAHVVRLGSVVVTVRIEDEADKVNLNRASEEVLRSLLGGLDVDPATAARVAAAIADWRSAGPLPRPSGAKAPQYAAAGRDFGPPGTDFRSLDELGAVLGVTPSLLARLRPHVTVWSDDDADAASRDPIVAAAMGEPRRGTAARPIEVQVASVIAEARGPNGAALAERAVVRINVRTGRHPYAMLSLERLGNSASH